MLRFCSLFSGSNGNSLFVSDGNTRILIDAGVSMKRIKNALASIGEDPDKLSALLVTHEHRDHSSCVGIIERGYRIPVYTTKGTWREIRRYIGTVNEAHINHIEPGESFKIGNIEVMPFSIPHDASDPVGYSFSCNGKKIAVATDIGHMNMDLLNYIRNSDLLLLESNHDADMLDNGPYPYVLKRRIKSDHGHLCNLSAGETIALLAKEGVKRFILGHLSGENNHPELAYETVGSCIREVGLEPGKDVELYVAERGITTQVFEV